MPPGSRVLGLLVRAFFLVAPASIGAAAGTPSAFGEMGVAERRPVDLDGQRILGLSTDAPLVAELAQDAEVTVIGPAEEAEGFVWVRVRGDTTRAIGYVRREFLSPPPDA